MAHPFFIVGSARSGTTLLRLILNAHPEVAVPPESRFVVELYDGNDVVEAGDFIRRLSAHKRFQAWDIPIGMIRDQIGPVERIGYADAIRVTFKAYAGAGGKSMWGDKTPRYVENLDLLARLFPESRFVHLVRDGRNVALSYADVPFGPKTVGKAAALWAKRVMAGRDACPRVGAERYLEVFYEDLVDDTEGVIRDICGFLELDFDPEMLEYTERARGSVLPRASIYNPHVTQKPQKNVRSWEDSMPPDQIEIFEAVAGDVLSLIGYERRYPNPGFKARVIGRISAAGIPVGKIRELS